jgi:hypothetical protein
MADANLDDASDDSDSQPDNSEFCNSRFPHTKGPSDQPDSDDLEPQSVLEEDETDMLANITADIDSMFLISHHFSELIDVSCREASIWKIGSSINRTYCDSGSRVNLYFNQSYPKPRFAHRSSPNRLPCEWFPNLTFCQLHIAEGITLWYTFYLLGSPSIRSCPYFTKVELSVFVSALNFAKNYWAFLPKTLKIVQATDQVDNYQKYMNHFQRFTGIVQYQSGKKSIQNCNENLPSSYGRIFVASIFEAMKLFADSPTWATDQQLPGLEVSAGINKRRSHGIRGFEPTLDRFSSTAAYMVRSGVLTAKSAGLKKCFERLPKALIDLNKKPEMDLFLQKSFKYLTDQVGLYFDPNIIQAETEDDTIPEPSNTDPHLTTLAGIAYSNTHAHFHLPRKFSKNVMVFYDLGLNIYPHDLAYSFLPSGMHSVWMVNNILNGNRIELPDGVVRSNDRLFDQLKRIDNRELLRKILGIISLRRVDGEEVASEELELEELRQNLERIPTFDFEKELLDLIQDDLTFSEPDESSSTQLGADEARTQVFRSKYTAYPIVATNGMFANVHSGKFRLDVEEFAPESEDDEDIEVEEVIETAVPPPATGEDQNEEEDHDDLTFLEPPIEYGHDDTPEVHLFQCFSVEESIIKGMQIYSPFTRTTSRKRVDKGQENIVRFPLRLIQFLVPDEFFKDLVDYKKCQDDLLGMIEWIEAHLDEYEESMAILLNAPTRVEFFLQYKPDLDLERENLPNFPNLGWCLKKVSTNELASHLKSQTDDCMTPILKLKEHMQIHKRDGAVASFETFTRAALCGLVVTAELLIALLDFHPYQPWHLKTFMSLAGKKHGSWGIPLQFQVDLSENERLLTGLRYGVNPTHMKRKISFGRGHEIQNYNATKANSMTVSIAFLLKKQVRLPLFFVQAIDQLKATLQHFSKDRDQEMLTSEENPGPADADSVDQYADLMLFQGIDYIYLANILTNERRTIMFEIIGDITSNLYNQNWHDLLTSKKHGASQVQIPVNDFPTSLIPFSQLLIGEIESSAGLNWGFHESAGQRVNITSPSKSPSVFNIL